MASQFRKHLHHHVNLCRLFDDAILCTEFRDDPFTLFPYISLCRYDEALDMLDSIIKQDDTNAAPRKRRVAILIARGKIPDAIKELTEYLKK
jgi:hypothetical protein